MWCVSNTYLVCYPLIASCVGHSHDCLTPLTFDNLHMPHDTVKVDVKAVGQLVEYGHVAIGDESVAARELREVVVVIPVLRRNLPMEGKTDSSLFRTTNHQDVSRCVCVCAIVPYLEVPHRQTPGCCSGSQAISSLPAMLRSIHYIIYIHTYIYILCVHMYIHVHIIL